MSAEYNNPLTKSWIEELHKTTADPHTGLVCTPALYNGLMTQAEWSYQTSCYSLAYRFEVDQMFACFVLLANNIELEV